MKMQDLKNARHALQARTLSVAENAGSKIATVVCS